MRGAWLTRVSIALLLVALVAAPAAAKEREVFTIQDERVTQSSGLADLGGLMVTMNDTGKRGVIYALDESGNVVGTTDFGTPRDLEAVSPGKKGHVWVGDIGDNTGKRESVVVYDVPIDESDQKVSAPAYTLSYPDGGHSAETLLVDPATQRLYIVTKEDKTGIVYAAPPTLSTSSDNPLEKIATLPFSPTDGAIFPGGKYLLLRDYSMAQVFSFPDFASGGKFLLPGQAQGEGLSVGAKDRVRLSSQGVQQPVLEISVPKSALTITGPPAASSPTATPSAGTSAGEPSGRVSDQPIWVLVAAASAGVAVAAALLWIAASLRRPRRRPPPRRRREPRDPTQRDSPHTSPPMAAPIPAPEQLRPAHPKPRTHRAAAATSQRPVAGKRRAQ